MFNLSLSRSKGLSQILYLIIAASVLMMVALSMIFMFNDTVGGSTGDAQACRANIDAQCNSGAQNINIPTNCIVENADGTSTVMSSIKNTEDIEGQGYDATVSCGEQSGPSSDDTSDGGGGGDTPTESPFGGEVGN